jgi:hypothetical protein
MGWKREARFNAEAACLSNLPVPSMERVVRTFRVKRPAGLEALVDEIHEFVGMSPRRSGVDYLPGPKRRALRTGEPVNLIDELTLQNARTGEILQVLGSDTLPAA